MSNSEPEDDPYLDDDELDDTPPVCDVDDEMTSLDQLRKYQFALRKICPLLDTYESVVLMQIVDRTTGWKRHAAWFGIDALHSGDRLYDGISRQLHRSRLMKALASLERRGVINRTKQRYYETRIFRVNYDVDLSQLAQSAPEERKPRSATNRRDTVSLGDPPVQERHWSVSTEDRPISDGDPIEEQPENRIRRINDDRRHRLAPAAPIDARSQRVNSDPADTTEPQRLLINPPPRRRRTID